MRILILVLLVLSITAAANSEGAPEQATNGTEVLFVFDREFPPYTYVENGSVQGFELDLLGLIGEEEGFKPNPKPMVWTEAQRSFLKGDADVIGGMVKTEERLRQYNFTANSHGTFDILTFVRDGSEIRSQSMLQGRNVSVENGSVSHQLLKDQTGVKVLAYDTEYEGLLALIRGEYRCLRWRRLNHMVQNNEAKHLWRQSSGYALADAFHLLWGQRSIALKVN